MRVYLVLLVAACCVAAAAASSVDKLHSHRFRVSRQANTTAGFSDCSALPNKGKCSSGGGICVDSKVVECSGAVVRKLCPGGDTVRCCRSQCKKVPAELPETMVVTRRTSSSPARGTQIPAFNKLVEAYPQGKSVDVKKQLGGAVDAEWIVNTCAIRMTYTLAKASNKAIGFPYKEGRPTVKDKDGTRLYFRVKVVHSWLRENFGKPDISAKSADPKSPGVDPAVFANKTGIIEFEIDWDDATGHLDLWDGRQMVECSHGPETARYFSMAKRVDLWESKPENPSYKPPPCPQSQDVAQAETDVTAVDNRPPTPA